MRIPRILGAVLEEYGLAWDGIHGVAHWARVYENGLRLCVETGANAEVVQLFAVLHDSRRINDDSDPDHGPRAAEFARTLHDRGLLGLSDPDFRLLHRACAGHTHERTHPDVTIQTCWDADRLDLGRVGISPDPHYLGTEAAKRTEILRWADARATFFVVPEFVATEWEIDLENRDSSDRAGRGPSR
jgi:uncharacterized protein